MKAKVAERGQVTIPKPLRQSLGIQPGAVLEFHEEAGRLVAEKQVSGNPVDHVFGAMGRGRNTDDVMKELRGHDHRR